jgi:hypothetical protein
LAPQHLIYAISPQGPNAAVYIFGEDATEALTPIPGSPVTITPNPSKSFLGLDGFGATVDPKGRFLFVPEIDSTTSCCQLHGSVVYSIDSNTGVVNSAPIAQTGSGITVHPSGRFAYATDFAAFPCAGFGGIDLSTNSPAPIPGSPWLSSSCVAVIGGCSGAFPIRHNSV